MVLFVAASVYRGKQGRSRSGQRIRHELPAGKTDPPGEAGRLALQRVRRRVEEEKKALRAEAGEEVGRGPVRWSLESGPVRFGNLAGAVHNVRRLFVAAFADRDRTE